MRKIQHKPRRKFLKDAAIISGAVLRVRPKLMTVITVMASLTPIFLVDGPGADVMRRIALPMLGGMLSTTVLTLIIIPAIYFIWIERSIKET